MRARYVVSLTMASLLLGGSTAWALDEEREACVEACHEAKAQCVDSCGTHDNPMECEADCRDAATNRRPIP